MDEEPFVPPFNMPWCLCQKRWYRILFLKNPLYTNKYYWFGWIDPESWLEWWHFGVPVRFYYWKRDKWINFPFTERRSLKMWEEATPVEATITITQEDN